MDGELDETGSALDEQSLDGMRWMKTRMEPVPSNERFRLDGPGLLDEQQMKPVPFWMDGWKLDGSWMDGQNLDGIWMELGWNLDEMQDETGSVLDGTLDGIYGNVLYFGMRCLKNNMIIVIIRLRVDNYLETLYILSWKLFPPSTYSDLVTALPLTAAALPPLGSHRQLMNVFSLYA